MACDHEPWAHGCDGGRLDDDVRCADLQCHDAQCADFAWPTARTPPLDRDEPEWEAEGERWRSISVYV